METENKTNTKLNVADFLELRRYFQNGEYQKIDKWFEKNKVSGNPELEDCVNKKFGFLFVKTNKCFSKPYITYQNDERIKREIAILKNLSFESQIKFIFSLTNISSNHFKILKLTPENEKILKTDFYYEFIRLITEKFTTKNFKEIDEIQEKLSFNIMEQKIDTAVFCYDIKYKGPRLIIYRDVLGIKQPIFSPKCDIIFNYSEDKRKFLEKRNIALPTIEEADALYYEMKKVIFGYNKEKLEQSFKNYEIIKLSLDLENELHVKNNLKRKIKI